MIPCKLPINISSGSSDRVRGEGEAEKHEIYAAAFGGHLFMTYFYRTREGEWPLGPLDPLLNMPT